MSGRRPNRLALCLAVLAWLVQAAWPAAAGLQSPTRAGLGLWCTAAGPALPPAAILGDAAVTAASEAALWTGTANATASPADPTDSVWTAHARCLLACAALDPGSSLPTTATGAPAVEYRPLALAAPLLPALPARPSHRAAARGPPQA